MNQGSARAAKKQPKFEQLKKKQPKEGAKT
jgi:hypothetical protein